MARNMLSVTYIVFVHFLAKLSEGLVLGLNESRKEQERGRVFRSATRGGEVLIEDVVRLPFVSLALSGRILLGVLGTHLRVDGIHRQINALEFFTT